MLAGKLKTGYKEAINKAKNRGRAETMYVEGGDYVKLTLGIEAENSYGQNAHDRSKFVSFPYVHKDEEEKKLENGKVIKQEVITTYLLVSMVRDDRCILKVEHGTKSLNVAEVAA